MQKVQQLSGAPITLTAGAGETALMTGVVAGDGGDNGSPLGAPYEGVGLSAYVIAETASALGAATLTVKVQRKVDGGSWSDVLTKVVSLRGTLGLVVPDRVTIPLIHEAKYTGVDTGTVQLRVVGSCTSANVSIIDGAMYNEWPVYIP